MSLIIMIMAVSFAGIFFLMTDTIMEPFRRYRAKSIAALLIMISLVFLYGSQLNYSGESSFDPYAVIIFCLGLLALLDTAINNYREMFKCLREQYGEELQAYIDSVISDFDNRFSSLEQKASTFRNDLSVFASMWKEANARKKAYLILILLVTVAVVVILTGISLKVSGIMMHG